MQLVRKTIVAMCVFAAALTAMAEQRSMEIYSSIAERNPFGLKDPVVPPPPVTNKPAADPKKEEFFLTGISTMGDPKRPKAYLLNKDASKKEYDQKFYTLSVGDKQGDVAVKEIDPKGRRVLIAYQGEDRWLSMKDNGVPAPSGPAPGPGGMPLVPGAPGSVPPPPGAVPLPNAVGNAAPAQPQPLPYPNAGNPRRTPRSTYNGAAINGGGGYVNPGYNVAGAPTVTPVGASQPATPHQQTPYQGPQNDAELLEQMVRMKSPDKLGGSQPGIPNPPTPF